LPRRFAPRNDRGEKTRNDINFVHNTLCIKISISYDVYSIKLKVVSHQYLVFSQNSKTKSAGNRVCDCHDMFPTCLAMTKSKCNMHKEIDNTRNFSLLCHCGESLFLSLRGAKRRGSLIHLFPHSLPLHFN
jgi:hypothetical protein